MRLHRSLLVRIGSLCASWTTLSWAVADDANVRYYKDPQGITWREETVKVQQPVRELELESRDEQVYRPQYTTNVQQYQYLGYSPTVQYQWVPRYHEWWRIFRGPTVAYHLEPQVTWATRPYTISVPTTQQQWVSETRTVQVPVAKLKMVEREQTVRTAVNSEPPQLAAAPAWSPPGIYSGSVGWPASDPYAPGMSYAWAPPTYGAPPSVYLPAQGSPPIYGGIARLDDGAPRTATSTEGWRPLR